MAENNFSIEKIIPSHPNYRATNCGEIIGPKGKKKKQKIHKGYYRITLYKSTRTCVAPLICEAFHGKRPDSSSQCRHLDGNKLNNMPSNLLWGTPQDNYEDKIRLGEMPRGERHWQSKLHGQDIPMIRFLASQHTQQYIANIYGVSQKSISNVILNKNWQHA